MALAAIFPITVEQGATWTLELTYTHADGTPVDLTGYTARMQLRRTYDSTPVAELTTSNGGILLGSTNGTVSLHMSAAVTAAIPTATSCDGQVEYLYDLELESPGGVVTRLMQGVATVLPEVTK